LAPIGLLHLWLAVAEALAEGTNAKGNVFERRSQALDLVGGLSTLSSKSFACLESIIRDDWFAQPLNDVGHGP
jgi:hypothetical protein